MAEYKTKKEIQKEYDRKRYLINGEIIKEKKRLQYKVNPQKHKDYMRDWRLKNIDRARNGNAKSHLKSKYNLTFDQYKKLF